jgi:AcrR family transcriptional regulator
MARPKSEDKCNAILSAATHIFAERGRGAATAAISSAAGLAEGTLFTYFKTKDELVSALYREIKLELADAMMSGFPRKRHPHQTATCLGSLCGPGPRESRAAEDIGTIAGHAYKGIQRAG